MSSLSDTEIAAFLDQLDGWRSTLTPAEQRILDTLLEAAASSADEDVEGFTWRTEQPDRGWPLEPRRIARVIRRSTEHSGRG